MSRKRTPEQDLIRGIKAKEYHKQHYQKYKAHYQAKGRRRTLLIKFGLTEEDYNNLLIKQNFSCALCNRHMSQFNNKLSVDHCHETGRIRGLLCVGCNTSLGYLGDNAESIKKVLSYVENINVGI